jgi:hypothetical protein
MLGGNDFTERILKSHSLKQVSVEQKIKPKCKSKPNNFRINVSRTNDFRKIAVEQTILE